MPRNAPIPKAVAAAWTCLILVACWIPAGHLPGPEEDLVGRFPIDLDKIIHLGLFLGHGFLWILSGPATPGRRWRVLGLGVGVAVVSELGQALPIVGRNAAVADALADTLGLLAGIGLAMAWRGVEARAGRSVLAEARVGQRSSH